MKVTFSLIAMVLTIFSQNIFALDEGKYTPLTEIKIADGRTVLATETGKVVYTFDEDQENVSNCYDGCARTWPPVLIQSVSELKAPMGATTRKDGTLQLTLNGQPIYLFARDRNPGDIKGDGLGGVWHIIVEQPVAGDL